MRVLVVAASALALCASASARSLGGTPVALVTAETQNALLAVNLDTGKVVQRLRLPAQPETIEAPYGLAAAVVSTKAGAVSLLSTGRPVRILHVIRGFKAPHIALTDPSGDYVYVTDDAAGTLSVIDLTRRRVVARLHVGAGAHHMAINPGRSELWIALGERARRIVVVDVVDPAKPRVIGAFDPGFGVHDLAWADDGTVWLTADDGPDVVAIDATTKRVRFRVPVGPPPQHVVFFNGSAYLTSGYGSRIVQVDAAGGKRIRSARVAYGSFNVATLGGYVLVSSLLNGTLTELTDALRPVRVLHLAPSTRDVAGAVWP